MPIIIAHVIWESRMLKKLFHQVYIRLPDQVRYRIARKLVKPPIEIPQEFTFKIAKTKEELEQAFRLLHDAYVDQGYMKPNQTGLRVTKFHALPTTTTLIAKYNDKVVGTVSILRDAGLGLPLDSAFDLNNVKIKYPQIAEVSSLAIQKEFRREHGFLLWPLLKYFYHYSKHLMRLNSIIVGVHPKWADFYLGILGFKPIYANTVKHYDFANGNPVVGYFLDLETAPLEYASMYAQSPENENLLKFFTSEPGPNFHLPDRAFYKVADPVMTPELLQYFFIEKSDIFENLSKQEALAIVGAYPQEKYRGIMEELKSRMQVQARGEVRFKVNCRALYSHSHSEFQILEVVNVSAGGFEIIGSIPKTANKIKLQLADNQIIELDVEIAWQRDQRSGVKVVSKNMAWDHFISYLGRDFNLKVG